MKVLFWLCKLADSVRSRYHTYIYSPYQCSMMKKCGTHVTIGKDLLVADYSKLSLGNEVYIGPGAIFLNSVAPIEIGNKVMLGPQVSIATGNHRVDQVGKYMYDVAEKLPENDKTVHIQDDVWVGMRAMILKGVTIGTGTVIAAGAVVSKDVPPYSIYINKDKILPRFTAEQIEEHQKKLGNYNAEGLEI